MEMLAGSRKDVRDEADKWTLGMCGFGEEETQKIARGWDLVGTGDVTGSDYRTAVRQRNYLRLMDLGRNKLGDAAKKLYTESRWKNFGRWSTDFIRKQADVLDDTETPFLLFGLENRDWNMSTYGTAATEIGENGMRFLEAEKGMTLRVVEIGDEKDALGRMVRVRNRYGSENIRSLWVWGHAGDDFGQSVVMGSNLDDDKNALSVKRLKGVPLEGMWQKLFDKRMEVVVIVCGGGKDGGLACDLNKRLGIRTVSMEKPAAPTSFTLNVDSGGFIRSDLVFDSGVETKYYGNEQDQEKTAGPENEK
jgi:hypothetical protein